MKKLLAALCGIMMALTLSTPARASDTIYDGISRCNAPDAGALKFAFKGAVTVNNQWDGSGGVDRQSFFYNNHGDGSYLVVTWYNHNRAQGTNILYGGTTDGPDADFLYANAWC